MKRRKKMSTPAKEPQTVNVRFECKAEHASTVFLAGSFNGWNESATPMSRDENGIWTASLDLVPSRYEYKFIIDGQWCCSPELLPDPSRASCVPNTLGTMNFAADV
jgi:1,4-alpha-glucan branching enzyme